MPLSHQGPFETAVGRHYESVLSGPSAVRGRAQASFTVAAAAATAIASAAALVDLEHFPDWVWFLVLSAGVSWLVVAGAFIRISTRVPPKKELEGELTAEQLARAVLRDARTEERGLERSLRTAVFVTYLALGLTAVAGISAWIAGREVVEVEVLLTSEGYSGARTMCADLTNPFDGETTADVIAGKAVIPVKLASGICDVGTLVLRQDEIRTLVSRPR